MGNNCGCGHCGCGDDNKDKTPEAKVKALEKEIEELGYKVEEKNGEIIVSE